MPGPAVSSDPASLESGVYLRHLHPDIGLSGDGTELHPLSSNSGIAPRPSLPPSAGAPAGPADSRTSGLYVLGAPTPIPPTREPIDSDESAIVVPMPRIESKSSVPRSSGPKSRTGTIDAIPPRDLRAAPLRPLPPPVERDNSLALFLWKAYALALTGILLFLWFRSLVISWIVSTGG